jgi:hypothetical protein
VPTTPVLDTFTDGSAPQNLTVYDAAHWANKTINADSIARTATGGTCGSTAAPAESSAYWSGVNAADVEVFATVTTKPANGAFLELSARIQNPASGSETAYHLAIFPVAGTDTWELWKHVAGAGSQIAVVSTTELNAGDVVSMRIIGNKISFYQNGVQLGSTVTDNSITGAGFIGLRYSDNTARLDDFGGGSINVPSSSWYDEASMYQLLGQPGAAVFMGYQDQGPNTVVAGTTFPQALTANDVVITATLTKQVNKTMLANVSITPTLTKLVSKTLSATSSITATLTKLISKPLTASTVNITATLNRAMLYSRTLSATVTVSATLSKLVNKNLAANVIITPTLTKQVQKVLSSTTTITATLTKQVQKILTATPVTITASMTAIKVFVVNMVATVNITASLSKVVNKNMTANVTITPTLTKLVSKTLNSTPVTITASLFTQFIAGGPSSAVNKLRRMMGMGQ